MPTASQEDPHDAEVGDEHFKKVAKSAPSTPDSGPISNSKMTDSSSMDNCSTQLRALFDCPPSRLQSLVHDMLLQMELGLQREGEMLKMLPAYVSKFPEGNETGTYCALDLGGTNLRVLSIELHGGSDSSQGERKTPTVTATKCVVPKEKRQGTASDLFGFIAEQIGRHESARRDAANSELGMNPTPVVPASQSGEGVKQGRRALGFTFSFPVRQTALDEGILVCWNKGFTAEGAIDNDIVALLQKELDARGIPLVCRALINDTIGTLLASALQHPTCRIGAIVGTGINACYIEACAAISKDQKLFHRPQGDDMVINSECGNFNSPFLSINEIDVAVDAASANPGCQVFEKCVSGHYLGDIVRRTMALLQEKGLCFGGYGAAARATSTTNWSDVAFSTGDMAQLHELLLKIYGTEKTNAAAEDEQRVDAILAEKGFPLFGENGGVGDARSDRESDRENDRKTLFQVCEAVAWRSVKLASTMLVATVVQHCKHHGPGSKRAVHGEDDGVPYSIVIAVDGTVYKAYPFYRERTQATVKQLMGMITTSSQQPSSTATGALQHQVQGIALGNVHVELVDACDDGSGVGAAAVLSCLDR